jgi:hypothetical protein
MVALSYSRGARAWFYSTRVVPCTRQCPLNFLAFFRNMRLTAIDYLRLVKKGHHTNSAVLLPMTARLMAVTRHKRTSHPALRADEGVASLFSLSSVHSPT